MTPKQTLEKIIEKAVRNGWKCEWEGEEYTVQELCFFIEGSYRVTHLLFDHSFARAYFEDMRQVFKGPKPENVILPKEFV